MADYDRYLAACEDRHAARLLDREEEIYRCTADDEAERARREDAYVKMLNCPVYQRVVLQGLPMEDDDDPEMAEDDDARESRLDRLMSAAEARFDEDRDREMEDR